MTRRTLGNSLARITFKTLLGVRPYIEWLYRPFPADLRRGLLQALLQSAFRRGGRAPSAAQLQPGISLIGYPFADIGLGEALRSLARSLEAVRVPVDVVNFDIELEHPQKDRSLAPLVTTTPGKSVNLFCVNADAIVHTMRTLGPATTAGRVNIIRPFWELAHLHPDWRAALTVVDEIWAPTTFVRDAFIAGSDTPVTHIPVAVSIPPGIASDRAAFGIPDNVTAFLFAFDFSSFPARKNPEAVLAAYLRAFADDRTAPVALIIKTRGRSARKDDILAAIRAKAAADPRIIVIDRLLDRMQMHRLTASVDVFVSLNRSEGFGLGLAEAMAMGKAAIATDFSGNRDFLTPATGFPVPWQPVPVGPDDYPFFIPGQVWAEPDIDAAAAIMRQLAADPARIATVGAAARRYIEAVHSPAAVGHLIKARLAELGQ